MTTPTMRMRQYAADVTNLAIPLAEAKAKEYRARTEEFLSSKPKILGAAPISYFWANVGDMQSAAIGGMTLPSYTMRIESGSVRIEPYVALLTPDDAEWHLCRADNIVRIEPYVALLTPDPDTRTSHKPIKEYMEALKKEAGFMAGKIISEDVLMASGFRVLGNDKVPSRFVYMEAGNNLPNLEDATVIYLGCGEDYFLPQIWQNADFIGIDTEELRRHLPKNMRYVVGNVFDPFLPERMAKAGLPAKADIVVTKRFGGDGGPLQGRDDPETYISTVRRFLKPGGQLVVFEGVDNYLARQSRVERRNLLPLPFREALTTIRDTGIVYYPYENFAPADMAFAYKL